MYPICVSLAVQILSECENNNVAKRPSIVVSLEDIQRWITDVRDNVVETEPDIQKIGDLKLQYDEIHVSGYFRSRGNWTFLVN